MTPLINNYYFIDDLPEDASNFQLCYFGFPNWLTLYYTKSGYGRIKEIHRQSNEKYSIVGWSDELTEEQAAGIVDKERSVYDDKLLGYKKYDKVFGIKNTARQSLESLIASKGITKRVLILKKSDNIKI